MDYEDYQIKQAEAMLSALHNAKDSVDGYALHQIMAVHGIKDQYMRTRLTDILGLAIKKGYSYYITEEGEKAYEMGFRAWLEERERTKSEPVPVKNVKSESEKKLEKWVAWGGIIGGIAAGIDILSRLLGLF